MLRKNMRSIYKRIQKRNRIQRICVKNDSLFQVK